MPVLTSPQRKLLEEACLRGRRASEQAVRASVGSLAVTADRPPAHLTDDDRGLRRGLRAKARQLGDPDGALDLLVAESAYEQWHRLLFARFLAENQLLIHPEFRVPVTVDDCEELAESLGEPDGWSVAGRFAAEILPGIFRLDDPCVQLRLAPEGRVGLENIVANLPADIFIADDALGWVYQFWQKDRKDEVNAAESKITGADLGPVTQLFTENYMVRFLLENSLGAWWAGRHPDSPLVKEWAFLRFAEDMRPCAGTFDDWPDRAADLTVMDPCCGSGHFLVEAFGMLWRMRAEEDGCEVSAAQDSVLRDNLFGLELDPRCVQLAMFSVALQAWKAGGGWRELPIPNIACSGTPVRATLEEWEALAGADELLKAGLGRLHVLFRDADTLGSLIDPRRIAIDAKDTQLSLGQVDWVHLAPLIAAASKREANDSASAVLGMDAASVGRAAAFLSRSYTLVVTNPPYLGGNRQSATLLRHSERSGAGAALDLAYLMKNRLLQMADAEGAVALVMPSEWLVSPRFVELRRRWLRDVRFAVMARLGYGSFQTTLRVNPVLEVIRLTAPNVADRFPFLDVSPEARTPAATAAELKGEPFVALCQSVQLARPDSVIAAVKEIGTVLGDIAECRWGLGAGDGQRFERFLWEVPTRGDTWEFLHNSTASSDPYSGRHSIVLWENETGAMAQLAESVRHLNHKAQQWRSGKPFWGRNGVALNRTGRLRATLYTGDRFSQECLVIVPIQPSDVAALWSYASSGQLEIAIRTIDRSLAITPRSVRNVVFDIGRWRDIAEEEGPPPEPRSNDPIQWLFRGRPETSIDPLQVAMARLLGYHWPEQPESDDLTTYADEDGIVCLPSVRGERTAAERLQELLARSFGGTWSPARTQELIAQEGSGKMDLATWLRDDFFKHHCALFQNRPFLWHIWDGRKDGFAAIVNYHRLDNRTLGKLTYSYLGDWIERQAAGVKDDVGGADERLAGARALQQRLELIIKGEPPHDVYVRWKTLAAQPIGWDPDFNDGVRLNVRPFVEAGVLRTSFNVKWNKDRGRELDASERWNDLHFTHAEKLAAREGPVS